MKVWKQTIQEILQHGTRFTDTDQKECIELLNQKIQFQNPEPAQLLNQMLKLEEFNYPNEAELQRIVLKPKSALTNFSHRMLDYEGINQLQDFIIPLLKTEPQTRRAIISSYNPLKDSNINAKSAISITTLFFRIVNDKIHLSIFIRSLDVFLGLPANLVQANTILNYVADALKITAGSITFFAGSAHVFKDQEKNIKKLGLV